MSRNAALALVLALLCLPRGAATAVPSRNLTLLSHQDEYPGPPTGQNFAYSACWAYIHGDGREYAVIGTGIGTAIYNVSDPVNSYRVGFIPGPISVWREMKAYRNWIYVVTEGVGAGQGLQIVRMTDPEHPVLASTYTTGFVRSHTVSVDTTRALLICNGTRDDLGNATGMHILSLANPEAPVEITQWPAVTPPVPYQEYTHDCVVAGGLLYAASIYVGIERIFDLSNPAAPTEIVSFSYPGAFYTHSSWPDDSGRWLYVTDEQNGQALRIFDLLTRSAPQLVNQVTSNPQAIIHNPRVKGSELYLANYTEGVRVLDISDPVHPAEFAWADTYPGVSGGYGGVWEACPYFPSGIVIASDMESGLYVFRPVRDYGLLRVSILDESLAPVAGQMVTLLTQGDSLATAPDGIVQFAPNPGVHTVRARVFGYYDATATRTVTAGGTVTASLTLVKRPVGALAGTVRDAATHAPLEEAEITAPGTPLHAHTDAGGGFSFPEVPADHYRLEARRAGFAPVALELTVGAGSPTQQDISLAAAAIWDPLETDTGWIVGAPGDDAVTGQWVRVVPLGTGTPPPPGAASAPARGSAAPATSAPGLAQAPVAALPRPATRPLHEEPLATPVGTPQPYYDHTPGAGTMCFVTGQGTNSSDPDEADVDYGHTTLTSPALDLSAMVRPTIGYWRWFYSWFAGTGQPDPADGLTVYLSGDDGQTWVAVDTTRGRHDDWEERAIAVRDYVTPGARVRVRFVAADLGDPSIVEAAVDDLTAYDAFAGPADVPPSAAAPLHFRAPWPNPAHGAVTLVLESAAPGVAAVDILDLGGRIVRTLYRGPTVARALELRWDGTDDRGRATPSGLYFARARAGGRESVTRLARTR